MTPADLAFSQAYTARNEGGVRDQCYDDATGKTLRAGDIPKGTPTIGVGCTGPDIVPGLVWPPGKGWSVYLQRHALAVSQAALDIGAAYWSKLDGVRQAALIDMAYEMGGHGLAGFRKMVEAVRSSDWTTAAAECLARNPVPTGGVLKRAQRNAQILLTGERPALTF